MIENVKCPDCDGPMIPRNGQYGKFWGCADFPKCKGTRDSMGRSKKDREDWKREQAKERGEDYEDIGPDSFKPNSENITTFNKK